MAWTFIEVIDSGRDRDIIINKGTEDEFARSVYWMRATFTDGTEIRCLTALFYDNPPTLQQRLAARNKILEQLNAAPLEREFIEEYAERLRDRINRARLAGNTPAQILTALENRLDLLIDN
jgi:hypothetical protein